jgi:hypothetical protein
MGTKSPQRAAGSGQVMLVVGDGSACEASKAG